MDQQNKRTWISPEIRKYGTFEAATQGCDKYLGPTDGFTFQGADIVCASGAS